MDRVDVGEDVEIKPRKGMLFNSENEAYDFYNSYGGAVDFSIRKDYAHWSNKDRTVMTNRRFVCSKAGSHGKDKRDGLTSKSRVETRTECQARMTIHLIENGKYECHDLVEEHNNELHVEGTTHFMRSRRQISDLHGHEINLVDDSGIKPKNLFEYMGRQAGGIENLGYTSENHLNYLRTKRQRSLIYGEVDYAHFGDVISFDTTFCTNKECRLFGVFVGFNHHRGIIIFGVALLYDETAESFKWLFDAFAEAHGHKKPITILTDQDAIANALLETWLKTWHIMQHGINHLGYLMKEGSSFLTDLKKYIFQYEDELHFEEAWHKLLTDHGMEDSTWLNRIYKIRYKWASYYIKNTFTLGMRSTQLSESLNGGLKDYLKSTMDVVQFFKHFERIVNDKRAKELKAEFDARNKLPRKMFYMSPVMKQVGEVYTPYAFEQFQEQYNWV
ncbi:protein FAR1-RELATED SEQUENCE 5-like [Macadamia integrifolia]|uniref:protein FAR1-RELATED SEQUENCE 5-like n=1 Tax=Macadamia integrifolia TaxID=60698 RepID=UPI001C4F3348|nr:protein FAR1-RELATED SEQUENCE 5-like [Macadamia integrifolia]